MNGSSSGSYPSVIARLAGGLGNQLFMYAFAKAMAERNGVALKLDIQTEFERDRKYQRQHLLQHLLPSEPLPNRWESWRFPLGYSLRKLKRKRNAKRPLAKRSYVRELSLRFDPAIKQLNLVQPTEFDGYWQAPQYFDDLTPPIAERIQFPDTLIHPIAEEAQGIQTAEQAVCLAIRRFEEVQNPNFPILNAHYFKGAMARLEQQIDNPHYFVFAQDLDWAKANIRSVHPVTFAQPKNPHTGVIQDLYLMTLCRHYIVSNSSLHWWAAWLGQTDKTLVLVPERGWPNEDMIADHWIRLA